MSSLPGCCCCCCCGCVSPPPTLSSTDVIDENVNLKNVPDRVPSVHDIMDWGAQRSSATKAPHRSSTSSIQGVHKKFSTLESFDGDDSVFVADQTSKILVLYSGGTIGMRSQHGVYVPEPNFLTRELRRLPILHDDNFAYRHLTDNDYHDMLAMPLSKDSRWILYRVLEYDPLLDSSNMTYDDYVHLATDISENYTKYDGFVVLHGTDTMAYTASALSFMLENLGKPVILTGSQIPIFEPRSDGRHNFVNALIFAANYNIPEVAICFDSVLLRGNRSTKVDNGSFDAFASPNMEPLAVVGVSLKVNWDAVFRHHGMKKFVIHTRMCRNVGVLRLFPGITEMTVQAFLQPPMEGVVLQTYGHGNWPTILSGMMQMLKEACDNGLIVINTTQCSRGTVLPIYAVGKELQEIGVVAGHDMTVEAALMKLSYILSKDEWSLKEKRAKVGESLRGEMTVVEPYKKLFHLSLIENLADTMRISSAEELSLLREAIFPYLLCVSAREGSVEALERLQQAGAQLNMADYDGRTALHIACCEGHVDVVRYLLDLGAPVHVRDRYGDAPLDDAVTFRRPAIVSMLRQTGAHLTMPPAKLVIAVNNVVANEDVSALQSWCNAGADFNEADYNGRTPLHVAVTHCRPDHVTFLLAHGADPRAVDVNGLSPLDVAQEQCLSDIVAQLKNACNTSPVENGPSSNN